MEMPQQPVGGESLQDAERKRSTADAAAGQAERGSRNRQAVNAPIKFEEIGGRPAGRVSRMQFREFLLQHREQRQGLRRRVILALHLPRSSPPACSAVIIPGSPKDGSYSAASG